MKCAFHDDNSLENFTKLQAKDRLVHEHLFIESVKFYVSCITCSESYCERCGRLVENQNKTIPEVSTKTLQFYAGMVEEDQLGT